MPALAVGRVINGNVYDYSSCTITINGIPYQGVTEISYSDSLEPGELRGTGAYMRGRTRGEYKAEGSFTMGKKDFEPVKLALKRSLSGGFAETAFLITVVYQETGDSDVITDLIEGCRIIKQENSHGGNSDALVTKIDLSVYRIRWNGLYAVADNVAAGGLLGA